MKTHPYLTLATPGITPAAAAPSRQALAPGGSPGPAMVNQTTTNTALVPGGSYMNGA